MPVHFQHTVHVARPPARVFAILDDLGQTPRWLKRCTGIEKLESGDNRVGLKLRYSYNQDGRRGTMDGEITARQPDQRLTFRYGDRMMDVQVDFQLAAAGGETELTHLIDITPKTFFAKLISPLMRMGLPKQTITAMETLKALAESAS
jgi:uncharacterized protein YndB with AHSA1/START domain